MSDRLHNADPNPDQAVEAALALLGLGDGVPADGYGAEAASDARELIALATAAVAAGRRPGPVAPPAALRARLMERIRAERFAFIAADAGAWQPTPGDPAATAKLLYDGGGAGERTRLVRLPAGDAAAALADAHDPALLVVDGELWLGETRCTRGDFVNADVASLRVAAPSTVLVVERGGAPAETRRTPVLPSAAGGWRTIAAGTRLRPLAGGPAESVDVMLLEMDAGGLLPEHAHGGLEEIFLLRGSCHCQGRRIGAGDYHRAAGGSEHEDTTTDEGCLMIVVLRKAA